MLQKPFIGEFRISQVFGENLNTFYKAEGLKGHTGIDFACPTGTPVIAPCDGTVIYISTDIQKGEGVTVLSDEIYKWNGKDAQLSCIHWHLKDKSIKVKVGDHVKTGQVLALSNNTGQTTGPHLHFSVAALEPITRKILAGEGNGYRGMIDPLLYLDLDTPEVKRTKELQELLNKYGAKLKADGIFGKLTLRALKEFVGLEIWNKVYEK